MPKLTGARPRGAGGILCGAADQTRPRPWRPPAGHNGFMAGLPSKLPGAAGLLLTGGGSRRMGQDKATIVVDGEELATRTAALLRRVTEPVIEVGPGYTSLPRTSEDPPGSGPLAAVVAGAVALGQLGHGASGDNPIPVLVVATDLPRLTAAYLQRLVHHGAASPEHSVVPRDARGRPQPLCARYSRAALAVAGELAAAGHQSMRALLERIPVAWIDADEVLRDIDTPEDLSDFRDTPSVRKAAAVREAPAVRKAAAVGEAGAHEAAARR
jgi:molybdopterin-guanine dinucleotide biosynthesis protein A